MDKSKRKGRRGLILIILLCLLPSLLCMLHKTQLHVDEVWTYALSNSADRPYLYVWRTGIGDKSAPLRFSSDETALLDTEGVFLQQWHSGEEFKRYVTVQEGERFQYSSVVYNQTCDVHPPLYYFIVHTICSFFPDSFSVWYAFLPNLVFLIGSLFLLYCIAIRLGGNRLKALLTVLFWGISRAGISDAVFLRMYMMLTFITLLSVYVHARFYEFHRGRYIILIFFINLAGFLTQYYYYIFYHYLYSIRCLKIKI